MNGPGRVDFGSCIPRKLQNLARQNIFRWRTYIFLHFAKVILEGIERERNMRSEKYNHADHCVFLIQYHIVWYPKFRYGVLKPLVDVNLRKFFLKFARSMDIL